MPPGDRSASSLAEEREPGRRAEELAPIHKGDGAAVGLHEDDWHVARQAANDLNAEPAIGSDAVHA